MKAKIKPICVLHDKRHSEKFKLRKVELSHFVHVEALEHILQFSIA